MSHKSVFLWRIVFLLLVTTLRVTAFIPAVPHIYVALCNSPSYREVLNRRIFPARRGVTHVDAVFRQSRPTSAARRSHDGKSPAKKEKKLPRWVRRILNPRLKPPPVVWIGASGLPGDEDKASEEQKGSRKQSRSPSKRRLPGSNSIRLLMSNPRIELKLGLLVVLSSLFVAIGTLSAIPRALDFALTAGEDAIASIFFVEYLLRWYAIGLRYGCTPYAIIDFLSVLPLVFKILPGVAGLLPMGANVLSDNLLVNLRLLRLLRFQRFLKDYDTFKRLKLVFVESEVKQYQLQLARVLLSFFTLLSVSAGLIFTAEHAVNPGMSNYFTALYFGVTTLTTVGFGDIAPVTSMGRMIVCCTIIAGAVILPIQISSFVEALLAFNRDKDTEKAAKKKSRQSNIMPQFYEKFRLGNESNVLHCPTCGVKPHRTDATFCWGCGSAMPVSDPASSPH